MNLEISNKFKSDIAWNIISVIILGIVGLVLNILIARSYGPSVLGVFNQVFAIYILGSQLAAGSIHLSVQKYLAEEKENENGQIISAGIFTTFFVAIFFALLIFLLRNLFGDLLKSPNVSFGIALITPGLVFFALNKVFMAILNGLRQMKSFAFFQMLRYILFLIGLIIIYKFKISDLYLPGIFTFSECILFFLLFFFTLPKTKYFFHKKNKWIKKHLIFGSKALLGNVLIDVNTRVDVLILGFFASDSTVGIYSFAAIIAEGFYQLIFALKINLNPILSKLASAKDKVKLDHLIQRGKKLSYFFIVISGIFGIAIYPLFLRTVIQNNDFLQSWQVFIILILGIMLTSGYLPFQMILIQAGFPQSYTKMIVFLFSSNVIFNFLLIPPLGMYGSAVATGLANIASVVQMKILIKKYLRINI